MLMSIPFLYASKISLRLESNACCKKLQIPTKLGIRVQEISFILETQNNVIEKNKINLIEKKEESQKVMSQKKLKLKF